MKLLKDIIYGVSILEIKGNTNIAIEKVTFDSREVQNLSLFIAIVGTQSDGHKFIKNAEDSGASAIVCEQLPKKLNDNITYIRVPDSSLAIGLIASNFYDNPSEKLDLIGITGTNGKTTCATLLYDLFRLLGYKTGLISTVNIRVLHKTYPSTHTTPDALRINEVLHEMVSHGCTHVFMEVSSHALDQNRTSGLTFKVGVFTNISRDHLDYHDSFDQYISCKKKLFDGLSNEGYAIINYDDKHGETMGEDSNAQILSYGLKDSTDFKCKVLENDISGLTVEIDGHEVTSRLVGRFNAYNLLTAYAVAKCLGQDELSILTILSSVKAPQGRFEYFVSDHKITAVIDYAHTPDALENVLKTIVDLRKGKEKIFTVFGCGGNRDKGKRPLMGEIASKFSDQIIITSDNPRNEDPESIIENIYSGIPIKHQEKVLTIKDRKEAISVACKMASSGDIILIAGKGHENYQIIGSETLQFDDMENAVEILKKLKK